MSTQEAQGSSFSGVTKALGLVFGDIGTSPIYTLGVIMALQSFPREDFRASVMGIISTILWTLVTLVTVQYAWLAMGFSIRGEGGTVVLKEILVSKTKDARKIAVATFLTYLGVSLLLGDGALTPAISILSAVEGVRLIPHCEFLTTTHVVIISSIIAILLFAFQYKGTDKVSGLFGPVMVIWFAMLSVSGAAALWGHAEIIRAASPVYAFEFFRHHGWAGFWILSEVILCATGAEALYADMGHLGRRPIRVAWVFVFIALVLNYLGQGAFIIQHSDTFGVLPKDADSMPNPFFEIVKSQTEAIHLPWLYIGYVVLTVAATIIASQAMISGVFSLVYQGINTKIFPLLKIKHTSAHIKSQIYIGAVNWMLLGSVLFIIVLFRTSDTLANAYGLAVCGTMAISAWLMIRIFTADRRRGKTVVAWIVFIIVGFFLISSLRKLPEGAYMSKIFAMFPFGVILLWSYGNRLKAANFKPLPMETFLPSYEQIYAHGRIPGTALFFAGSREMVSPYIVHCVIASNIIYERNVLVCVRITDEPYGEQDEKITGLGTGLEAIEITLGYLESPDIPAILAKYKLKEKVLFYGVDEIKTTSPLIRIYALMKKMTPSFVQFYNLPSRKVHGVINHIEM